MKKIGLTGGIGSGKSIICDILKIMGHPVFNSDNEAKNIMTNDEHVIQQVKDVFGNEAYNGNVINRPFLAKQIFSNSDLKEKLNNIIHPAVRIAFDHWAKAQNKAIVFNEAAILFETGAYKTFDYTILVTAPEEIRISRVTDRDSSTHEEVKQRMNNQWKDEIKVELASFVIQNDNTQLVTPQIISILNNLEKN